MQFVFIAVEGLLTTHSSMDDCNYRLANNLHWYKIIMNEFCRIYLNIFLDIRYNLCDRTHFVTEIYLRKLSLGLLIDWVEDQPKPSFHIIFFRKYWIDFTFATQCKMIHRTSSSWIDFYDFSINIRIMKLKYMCKVAHFLTSEKFQS